MAKRLTITPSDSTEYVDLDDDTWIELSGELTRAIDRLIWDEGLTPLEATQLVLGDVGLDMD